MPQIRKVTASNIDAHWLEWLGRTQSFRYVPSENAPFTVRKEKSRRGDGDYWYGYRKVGGKLHKRYIGKAEDLTVNRLEEIANRLNIGTEPRLKPEVLSDVSFTQNEEIARLQALTTRLQNELQFSSGKVESLTAELETVRLDRDKLQNELQRVIKLGDEVNARLLQLKQENWHLEVVGREKDKLQKELQIRLQTQDLPPDYQAVRDRTLNKLKMGRQSASGKAIDAFIKELKKN